jgi:hypothetical protein
VIQSCSNKQGAINTTQNKSALPYCTGHTFSFTLIFLLSTFAYFIFMKVWSKALVYVKFVGYKYKVPHNRHICKCSLTNNISHVLCRYVYIVTKSHVNISYSSPVIVIKLRVIGAIHTTAMLLFYIIDKYWWKLHALPSTATTHHFSTQKSASLPSFQPPIFAHPPSCY